MVSDLSSCINVLIIQQVGIWCVLYSEATAYVCLSCCPFVEVVVDGNNWLMVMVMFCVYVCVCV